MRGFIERALALVLCAGTAAVVQYVALNRLLPLQRPLTFAMAFLGWGILFYLVTLLPPLLLCGVVARALRRPLLARAALLVVGVGFVVALSLNPVGLTNAFRLGGPLHFRVLTPLALLVASAGLLVGGAAPLPGGWRPRLPGVLAPLLALFAFLPGPERATPPLRVQPSRLNLATPRFVFVGVDGADWSYIEPLIKRGELPTIAALRQRGAWGPLNSLKPTASPALWTTVVTGQPISRHGIRTFTNLRVRGVRGVFWDTDPPRATGFQRLFRYLQQTGRVSQGPVMSSARRTAALWEIATAEGSPISVVGWWGTWPAEEVLGTIVSERVHYYRQLERHYRPEDGRLTYPEDLYESIKPLIVAPADVTYDEAREFVDVPPAEFESWKRRDFVGKTVEGELTHFVSMFETDRRAALHVIEWSRRRFGAPADLLVLFRIVDIGSHAALRESELVPDHLGAPPEDIRRYSRVVSECYRRVDRALGEIIGAMGDANVIVASDHGFHPERDVTGPLYHHRKAPPGIFVAAGPAFKAGRVEGLGLYDLLPLLAYLKGFPQADDLPGRVPEEIFAPSFVAAQQVRRVASYGRRGSVTTGSADEGADEAMMERLRALGYVN